MNEQVAFEGREDVLVARLSGEIDISTVDGVEAEILAEISRSLAGGLVVDLSGVVFLDSVGVRLLFTLHRVLTEQGRPVAIVVPEGSRIATVLSIVEIETIVWVAPTVDEAVARLFAPEAGEGLEAR